MGISPDLELAHKHCLRNCAALEQSDACGCFYCERIFFAVEIDEWTDDEQTALCPHCGIDSVLPSAPGFQLSKEFLHRMHERWF